MEGLKLIVSYVQLDPIVPRVRLIQSGAKEQKAVQRDQDTLRHVKRSISAMKIRISNRLYVLTISTALEAHSNRYHVLED